MPVSNPATAGDVLDVIGFATMVIVVASKPGPLGSKLKEFGSALFRAAASKDRFRPVFLDPETGLLTRFDDGRVGDAGF